MIFVVDASSVEGAGRRVTWPDWVMEPDLRGRSWSSVLDEHYDEIAAFAAAVIERDAECLVVADAYAIPGTVALLADACRSLAVATAPPGPDIPEVRAVRPYRPVDGVAVLVTTSGVTATADGRPFRASTGGKSYSDALEAVIGQLREAVPRDRPVAL